MGTFAPTPASATLARSGAPAIDVHALGPMGLIKIHMASSDLTVVETDGNVVLTSSLLRLADKDSDLRTRHMREELEADKFPDVVLTVGRANLTFPADGASATGSAPATLALHGVTKPTVIQYSASAAGRQYDVSGSLSLDYTAFLGHKISKFGATVQPTVKVDVKFQLVDTN
jgi:hypothetical protein